MRVIIVTGMSGSGKTKALDILEDNGYYCLDNLPVKILPEFMNLILRLDDFSSKVCITVDVRNTEMSDGALSTLESLSGSVDLKIVFLDCDNSVLVKRYKESRRLHPLMMTDTKLDLQGAINKERDILEQIKSKADYIIDTSLLTTGELKEKINEFLPENEKHGLSISFTAFGYKYGIPADCDIVFDVRCLPNPFYVDELKTKTGKDHEVRDFVMSYPESRELLERIIAYLDSAIPMYNREGRSQLVVGLGCTGGQHRSLTFAILLAEHYKEKGLMASAFARDSERNMKKYL
ncbi:MAG: RNase adapter RapZ [Lachnospiraceae bacterium]|nr:RNase adapter RapZ [Lachnospiraceae bacterium]